MNIKPESLRIGNLMREHYTDKIISVIELKEKSITFSDSFIGKWQADPIELTEEILLKVGFEKKLNGKIVPYDINEIYRIYSDKDGFEFWVLDKDYEEVAYCKLCKLTYLHQLQNLLYSLCGKELDVSKLI